MREHRRLISVRLRRGLPLVLVLVAACGSGDDPGVRAASPTSSEVRTPGTSISDVPPPVTITWDGGEVALDPWTYCYGNVCADGMPPEAPATVGDAEEVTVDFPIDGWTFEASFTPADQPCGRTELATVAAGEALVPHGRAGEQEVTLFGRGRAGGDLFVTFLWSTPVDGPLTPPGATTSIVADHDGVPDSYGVELGAHHLARTPAEATASVVVTASDGASRTIELRRVPSDCDDATVRFDADLAEGLAAAALGEPPFTYDVTLTLDGGAHRAVATWPDDVDPTCSPCVVLDFDPPLPSAQ